MSINYTTACINFRLTGVVNALDSGGGPGVLQLYDAASALLVSIALAVPAGTVAAGVLSFTVPQSAVAVLGGLIANATMANSAGTVMISGLTVGIPLSGAELIVTNGKNSLQVVAGDIVTLLAGQIVGS